MGLRIGPTPPGSGVIAPATPAAASYATSSTSRLLPSGPAMQSIGDAWYAQKIGIFHEHRATHICLQAIMGLKRFLDDREISPEAPIAVGGSPEGHWHSLANFLADFHRRLDAQEQREEAVGRHQQARAVQRRQHEHVERAVVRRGRSAPTS